MVHSFMGGGDFRQSLKYPNDLHKYISKYIVHTCLFVCLFVCLYVHLFCKNEAKY